MHSRLLICELLYFMQELRPSSQLAAPSESSSLLDPALEDMRASLAAATLALTEAQQRAEKVCRL